MMHYDSINVQRTKAFKRAGAGKHFSVKVEACNHVQKLVEEFSKEMCSDYIKGGGKANQEWSKWSLMTHTVMCAISERAMRDGIAVELDVGDDGGITKYMIGGETFNESMISQQRDWTDY